MKIQRKDWREWKIVNVERAGVIITVIINTIIITQCCLFSCDCEYG